METQNKITYESPRATVVDVTLESGILTVSNYYENPYFEE